MAEHRALAAYVEGYAVVTESVTEDQTAGDVFALAMRQSPNAMMGALVEGDCHIEWHVYEPGDVGREYQRGTIHIAMSFSTVTADEGRQLLDIPEHKPRGWEGD